MAEQLKTAAGCITSLMLMAVLLFLGAAAVGGMVWVSATIYPWVAPVAGVCLLIDAVLLPLAIFRRLRGPISFALVVSSYVYGLSLWLYSCLLAFILWGYAGLYVGLAFVGVGVVPVAFIATLLGSHWHQLGAILLVVALTYGARIGGILLAASAEQASS
jgi:hypothetical protein